MKIGKWIEHGKRNYNIIYIKESNLKILYHFYMGPYPLDDQCVGPCKDKRLLVTPQWCV